MRVKLIKRTMYIALDGKEFSTERACRKHEIDNNLGGAKDKKVRELLSYLASVKHGNSVWTIAGRQKKYALAKAALLKAAKGKRRYLRKFAEDIAKAAREFIDADDQFKAKLRDFKDALAELKTLEPKFDKRKATSK